jgi:hypothetical protein
MAQTAKVGKGDPEEFITFDDIFALALKETKWTRFTSKSEKWHQAMYNVCQKYRDKIPALREIFFDRRPPLYLQTDQFYQLISTLSTSGLITLPNPDYKFIQMSKTQKKYAKELEQELLEKYKEHIAGIAEILQDQLAPEE